MSRSSRSPLVTSRIMSAIRSKDTGPERLLASAMWRIGLRPVKHRRMFGNPDFFFIQEKIVVFCDGDFWHGNNWRLRGLRSLRTELSGYSPKWRAKINRNVKRDRLVSQTLKKDGYWVLGYWESKIKRNAPVIAARIKAARDRRRASSRFKRITEG